jgi:hypothetical protein
MKRIKDEKQIRELAYDHFDYISKVLETHGETPETIAKIRFHYIEAMVHGYKHALEDYELSG